MKFLLSAITISLMLGDLVSAQDKALQADVTVTLSDGSKFLTEAPFLASKGVRIPLSLDSLYGLCVMHVSLATRGKKEGGSAEYSSIYITLDKIVDHPEAQEIFTAGQPFSLGKEILILKSSLSPGKEMPELRPYLQSISVKISEVQEK